MTHFQKCGLSAPPIGFPSISKNSRRKSDRRCNCGKFDCDCNKCKSDCKCDKCKPDCCNIDEKTGCNVIQQSASFNFSQRCGTTEEYYSAPICPLSPVSTVQLFISTSPTNPQTCQITLILELGTGEIIEKPVPTPVAGPTGFANSSVSVTVNCLKRLLISCSGGAPGAVCFGSGNITSAHCVCCGD